MTFIRSPQYFRSPAGDDRQAFVVRRDMSGGVNTRQFGHTIAENEATLLYNTDLGVPGETSKRPGLTLIQDLGNNAGTGLFGFEPDGGANELLATEGTNLKGYTGSGTFTSHKTDFTTGLPTTMIKAGESGEGDVVLISNGTDNVFRMNQSHSFQDLGDTNTSPPKTTVMTYFRNRVWAFKSDLLYYSSAFPADYSSAFDRTSNAYRIPTGTERGIVGVRDSGLIVAGADQIWAINPSATPAATDKPEKILDIGCAAAKTFCQVGDDIYFLAPDGVRGVFRTQQDKLQLGASYPLSYRLKDQFADIAWASISKACAVYFDNKYFISLPTSASTTNNQVWVYYPANNGWMIITGWNVAAWAKIRFSGEEKLFAIESADGKVHQAWKGFDDNGTAINYQEEGRKEDLQLPMVKKAGGIVRVRAVSSGSYDVDVSFSADDQDYSMLGTLNLAGNAPTLPVNLPFTLAQDNVVEETFHLDSFGEWYTGRIKIQHNDTNGTDDIRILERMIASFPVEFQDE